MSLDENIDDEEKRDDEKMKEMINNQNPKIMSKKLKIKKKKMRRCL